MAYLKAVLPNTRRSVKSTSTQELDRDRGIFLAFIENLVKAFLYAENPSIRNLEIPQRHVIP